MFKTGLFQKLARIFAEIDSLAGFRLALRLAGDDVVMASA